MTSHEEVYGFQTPSLRRPMFLGVLGLTVFLALAASILGFPLGAGHADSTTIAISTTKSAPTTSAPTTTPASPAVSATPPPSGAAPAATPAPVPVPTATQTAESVIPPTASPSVSPEQLGADALALVRYPWQSIPGYSIRFLPISDAPEPGFYGNTTFTWGSAGGVSTMYVYPGETVGRLAGITAFEIGHEVDAAGVEADGGHAAIESSLGIHSGSWAPDCDCAEQGFLSGWYAAAFSNYWSPGVGNWSPLAPTSGPAVASVLTWLNPTIV